MTLAIPKAMEVARASLLARVENTEMGVCPVCRTSMATAEIEGIDCYICLACRVSMPLPDDPSIQQG